MMTTVLEKPDSTIMTPAIITAVTGATGMKSNTIIATIASIIAAASGAL